MKRSNMLLAGLVVAAAAGCGGGGGGGAVAPAEPAAPAAPMPTVTLSIDTPKIALGQSAKLTWSSTNATACVASGAWTGAQAISGTSAQRPGTPGSSTYTLTCTGAGGTANQSLVLVAAASVQKSSYANAKQSNLMPIHLPKEVAYADAYAQADFKRDGTLTLFAAKLTYSTNLPASSATPSQFAFYSKASDGSWVKEGAMIDTPNGCIHPRKAVVADFNADGKPDVLVACHGYDGAPFVGEQMWLVMSSETDGKYISRPIADFVGFFHSATAADFDGDGRIDILATDTTTGDGVRLFLNQGNGKFAEAKGRLPADVRGHYYYSIEATDVDGDGNIDIIVGGNEAMNDSRILLIKGNGSGSFANAAVTALPGVVGQAVVLDFAVANGAIYVDRTSGDAANTYNTKAIQKIDLKTQASSVVFSQAGDSWFPWLIPVPAGVASYDLDRKAEAPL